MKSEQNDELSDAALVPAWAIVGAVALILVTAIAAPFYTQVMAGAMWAGELIRTLCGW